MTDTNSSDTDNVISQGLHSYPLSETSLLNVHSNSNRFDHDDPPIGGIRSPVTECLGQHTTATSSDVHTTVEVHNDNPPHLPVTSHGAPDTLNYSPFNRQRRCKAPNRKWFCN